MTALTLILPIFGLVIVGWLASLSGLISERVGDGLSEYVFALAVPALIVATLTRPGLSARSPGGSGRVTSAGPRWPGRRDP